MRRGHCRTGSQSKGSPAGSQVHLQVANGALVFDEKYPPPGAVDEAGAVVQLRTLCLVTRGTLALSADDPETIAWAALRLTLLASRVPPCVRGPGGAGTNLVPRPGASGDAPGPAARVPPPAFTPNRGTQIGGDSRRSGNGSTASGHVCHSLARRSAAARARRACASS